MARFSTVPRSHRKAVWLLVAAAALAAWMAIVLSADGTYAAAPSDPSPGKGGPAAPAASPTVVCGYDWRTVSSPNGEETSSILNAVTAVSPTDAWAVGYQDDAAGFPRGPLAMHWDGTAWTLVPVPGAAEAILTAVDAVAANDVWAVGRNWSTQQPVSMHWDGVAWTEVHVPSVEGSGFLYGVDVISTNDVWAVGNAEWNGLRELVLHWDGSAWNAPWPLGLASVNAVYAVAANDVWAVGLRQNRYWYEPMTLHWDGSFWTEVHPGFLGPWSNLSDVSGLSSDQVWAVGNHDANHTMILRWDGTDWSTMYDAAFSDIFTDLEAIAPDNIWAVGPGGRLHWNGTVWSQEALPENVRLKDIAAIDSGDIWAVGTLTSTSSVSTTLTQRYSYACTTPTPTPTGTATPTSTPTPIPPRCPAELFTDVCPTDYFYEPVLALSDLNIINGYSTAPPCDGPAHIPCFKPYNGSTRGQIAKVVSLAAGFSEPVSGQTFEDVLPGSTFYEYIERMASRDIIQGYLCGGVGEPCVPPENRPYFRPNNPVTRGQLSKMTSEAFGFSEPVSGQTFEDVPPTGTFYEWVQRIASRGIIQGYPCGGAGEPCVPPDDRPYFRPNNPVTRGQTAKIVYLAMLESPPTPTPTATVEPAATSTATNTPAPPPSSTPTSTPPTPQATPTCCNQVTGSIQAGCVGSAYQVTTTVTNSCGITLTANIATVFNVAPTENGPWQTLYVGDCFNCPVPPGTQQQTSNVYSGPLPPGNNWWRFSRGYYSTNGCWQLVLLSEPQPACVTPTPTPAPRAAPGP